MKSLIALEEALLLDAGERCGTSTIRDVQTVTERFQHEGLSFLTIALPNFCSDFEKSLDQGFVAHDQYPGFIRTGGLPRFLGGFLELVFDRRSGVLVEEPSWVAIQAVRQVTLAFSKVLVECTERRTNRAFRKFLDCERDVRRYDAELEAAPGKEADFSRVARLLWVDYLTRVDVRIYQEGVLPKHGPGATADKLQGNLKYNQLIWTRRLDQVFPHWENLIPSESFLERVDEITLLEPGAEVPVRVIAVPKTLKTPRTIAIEPTCMQYMQQGILDVMVKEMPRHDNTRNFVRFESQTPNQRLAREGSLSGDLATLDLSEASDRVSNRHVELLVQNHRLLRQAVAATRSLKADVRGEVITLAKFASMGSALCFPFEALVFTTVVFLGIEQELNRQLTKKDVRSLFGKVRVYGDDIIVPTEFVPAVIGQLEAFGFRVNVRKSFWTGKFRESCGMEFYDGHDVTVARCRRLLAKNRRQVHELMSMVSLRDQLFHSGYAHSVEFLDRWIKRLIPFPFVEHSAIEWMREYDHSRPWLSYVHTSPLLGRCSYGPEIQPVRRCPDYQIPLVKGMVVSSKSPASVLDDYGALMKWFLKPGLAPFADRDHLAFAGRPRSVHINTRWVAPS